jgi:hypothetical protein
MTSPTPQSLTPTPTPVPRERDRQLRNEARLDAAVEAAYILEAIGR